MSWTKVTFHVSPDDVRDDHAQRPLKVGEPVGFDDEFFVITGIRDDGSYDIKPHPREEAIVEAMLNPGLAYPENMKAAWKIGTLTPEEVAALP